MEDLEDMEEDAGLGNGGLGRLAGLTDLQLSISVCHSFFLCSSESTAALVPLSPQKALAASVTANVFFFIVEYKQNRQLQTRMGN